MVFSSRVSEYDCVSCEYDCEGEEMSMSCQPLRFCELQLDQMRVDAGAVGDDFFCSSFDIEEIGQLTVGDFDRMPSNLVVDEERCLFDGQYRRAVYYLEGQSPHRGLDVRQSTFDTCKMYRDAVNLLIADERVSVSCSFGQWEEDIFGHHVDEAQLNEMDNQGLVNWMLTCRQQRE